MSKPKPNNTNGSRVVVRAVPQDEIDLGQLAHVILRILDDIDARTQSEGVDAKEEVGGGELRAGGEEPAA